MGPTANRAGGGEAVPRHGGNHLTASHATGKTSMRDPSDVIADGPNVAPGLRRGTRLSAGC